MNFLLSYQLLVCKRNTGYEPGGREFESLRARQIIQCSVGLFATKMLPLAPVITSATFSPA